MNQFLITSFAISLVVYYISAYSEHDDDDHDRKRSYKYDYSVQDSHTGDVRQQHKVTHEQYVLAEPGRIYSDDYEVEPHNDFDTEVKRIGRAHHNHASHHHPNPHHFDDGHHNHRNNVNFRERFGEI